jgi:hypothetical protein
VSHNMLLHSWSNIETICSVPFKTRTDSAPVSRLRFRNLIIALNSTRGPHFKQWLDLPNPWQVISPSNCSGIV